MTHPHIKLTIEFNIRYTKGMGVRIVVGVNDLPSTHPHLVTEWRDTRDASTVTAGSHYKAAWECSRCAYPWQAVISSRSKGAGCPRCAGRVPFPGKSFGDQFPELVTEWDDANSMSPLSIGPKSNIRAWWVCALGHRWKARVADRTGGTGCRVCAGKEVLAGFNDLASSYPHVAAEWHPSNSVSADQVTKTSGKRFLWLCAKKHRWTATVAARTSGGNKCPYCSGRRAIRGSTDLLTTHPDVAAEWHPSNSVNVFEVKRGSSVDEYMWVCGKGHVQRKTVRDRVEFGCTTCSKKGRTSRGERELSAFLVGLGVGEVETSVRHLPSLREVDAAIHSLKVAVEFNGVYWHSTAIRPDSNFHLNKYLAAREDGYLLIQVWEDDWRDHRERTKMRIRSVLGLLPPVPPRSRVHVNASSAVMVHGNHEVFRADYRVFRGTLTISDVHGVVDYASAVERVASEVTSQDSSISRVRIYDDLCASHEDALLTLGYVRQKTLAPKETWLSNGSRVPFSREVERAHRVFDAGTGVYVRTRLADVP